MEDIFKSPPKQLVGRDILWTVDRIWFKYYIVGF